jgi:hypothetical protein
MTASDRVDLQELRAALARVLDAVETRFGPTVELRADYYWTLDLRRSFDPTDDQSEGLTLAQLSDDLQEVRDVVGRADDPVVWHDLVHITGILRGLAARDLADETPA